MQPHPSLWKMAGQSVVVRTAERTCQVLQKMLRTQLKRKCTSKKQGHGSLVWPGMLSASGVKPQQVTRGCPGENLSWPQALPWVLQRTQQRSYSALEDLSSSSSLLLLALLLEDTPSHYKLSRLMWCPEAHHHRHRHHRRRHHHLRHGARASQAVISVCFCIIKLSSKFHHKFYQKIIKI